MVHRLGLWAFSAQGLGLVPKKKKSEGVAIQKDWEHTKWNGNYSEGT